MVTVSKNEEGMEVRIYDQFLAGTASASTDEMMAVSMMETDRQIAHLFKMTKEQAKQFAEGLLAESGNKVQTYGPEVMKGLPEL